jgi:hypothetical protein
VTRRDIDQQPFDVTKGNGLKVFADLLDVPAADERNAWLNNVPRLFDEFV